MQFITQQKFEHFFFESLNPEIAKIAKKNNYEMTTVGYIPESQFLKRPQTRAP